MGRLPSFPLFDNSLTPLKNRFCGARVANKGLANRPNRYLLLTPLDQQIDQTPIPPRDLFLSRIVPERYAHTMSEIARIRTHADRSVPEKAAEFLAAGLIAHVGIVQDGQPFVIPMIYGYDPAVPDRLYLHGSQSSRLQNFLATGAPVCVEVTTVDGLVYSRSALYHSANYRSVVCFGTAHPVADAAQKDAIFEKMITRYFAGRTPGKDYLPSSQAELDATSMVEVRIREMSAKMRVGPPAGPNDRNPDALGTCGVEEFVLQKKDVPAGR